MLEVVKEARKPGKPRRIFRSGLLSRNVALSFGIFEARFPRALPPGAEGKPAGKFRDPAAILDG